MLESAIINLNKDNNLNTIKAIIILNTLIKDNKISIL